MACTLRDARLQLSIRTVPGERLQRSQPMAN